MAARKYRTILLFGPPGVGKGTQGQALGTLPGFLHVSSGDCFRALDPDSPTGRKAAGFMSRGALVPDDVTVQVWQDAMDGFIADGRFDLERDLLILDGLPRNVPQAEILKEHVDVLRVVCLVCSDEEAMVARIKGRALEAGRVDDADEDVIRRRFEVYRQETEPLLAFYPPELRCEIDALRSPAEVLRDVLECVISV